jgi:Fe2+ or Zn2+ uptake regulation protein
MRCKTLINILGKHNQYSILAAFNLKPEKIVFLRGKEDWEGYVNTKACIEEKQSDIRFEEYVLKEESPLELEEFFRQYDRVDTVLNLSGGSKLMSLLCFQAIQGSAITGIYIDNDKGRILKLNRTLELLMSIDTELKVEDIICSTGAEIIKNSTELYEKKQFKELVEYMVENYDMWKLVKDILRHSHFVKQFVVQPLYMEIMSKGLSYIQMKALKKFLRQLADRKLIIKLSFYSDHIEFTFADRESKSFVMTTGCWLEALTYRSIKETKEVNDAISGMLFVWAEELEVHNELDVVAAVDSHLVCVSCKDTANYDIEDLNELEVYAEHLGGLKVTKLLVSTHLPERGEMICQRAEEMGIYLVIFEGDWKSFKNELHRLIL